MRPFQNIPLPPRIHPPFQQLNATFPESTPLSTTIILCDAHRIYPSFPEYTHFSTTILLYHSPRIYPSLHLSQNIPPPPSFNNYMRHSQKLPLPRRTPPPFIQLYAPFPLRIYPFSPFYNYMRYSKNIALSH